MLKDPHDEIKRIAKLLFWEEIKQLEDDGYLIMYRDVFLENGVYFLDVDVVKEQIMYKLRAAKERMKCPEDYRV